jgi:hypothetical protein
VTDPIASTRSKAEHYRELALWTNDERTQRILLEMARELETPDPVSQDAGPRPLPAALN